MTNNHHHLYTTYASSITVVWIQGLSGEKICFLVVAGKKLLLAVALKNFPELDKSSDINFKA